MDEKLIFDKTELIYSDMTSGRQVMRNVVYSDIKSILVGRKLVKKFFGLYRKVTPAILITVNGVSYRSTSSNARRVRSCSPNM